LRPFPHFRFFMFVGRPRVDDISSNPVSFHSIDITPVSSLCPLLCTRPLFFSLSFSTSRSSFQDGASHPPFPGFLLNPLFFSRFCHRLLLGKHLVHVHPLSGFPFHFLPLRVFFSEPLPPGFLAKVCVKKGGVLFLFPSFKSCARSLSPVFEHQPAPFIVPPALSAFFSLATSCPSPDLTCLGEGSSIDGRR